MAKGLEFKLSVVGLRKTLRRIKNLEDFHKSSRLKTILEDAKNRMVFIANRLAPKASRYMSSSIKGVVENFGSPNVQIRVGTPARYAPIMEFGTKKKNYPITPKIRKALFWVNYSTARKTIFVPGPRGLERAAAIFTFRKEVTHPGVKARPFMRPALKQVHPRLVRAIQRAIKEMYRSG